MVNSVTEVALDTVEYGFDSSTAPPDAQRAHGYPLDIGSHACALAIARDHHARTATRSSPMLSWFRRTSGAPSNYGIFNEHTPQVLRTATCKVVVNRAAYYESRAWLAPAIRVAFDSHVTSSEWLRLADGVDREIYSVCVNYATLIVAYGRETEEYLAHKIKATPDAMRVASEHLAKYPYQGGERITWAIKIAREKLRGMWYRNLRDKARLVFVTPDEVEL